MGLLKVPNRTFQGSQTEAPLPGVLNGHWLCSRWGFPPGHRLGGQDSAVGGSGEPTSPPPPVSLARPRCPGLIWSEPAMVLPLGLQLPGYHRLLRPPGLLPRPPGPEVGGLGRARSPGSGPGCGGLPGIAAQGMGEGFPSFCLYMAEARQRCSDRPAGPGRIVLRGCLASGSEALDSCKILAGKLFDSSDKVLEAPREACPGGPRARGVSAARRAGELGQPTRGCPPRGPRAGSTPTGPPVPERQWVCAA